MKMEFITITVNKKIIYATLTLYDGLLRGDCGLTDVVE